MSPQLQVIQSGTVPYVEALKQQEALVARKASNPCIPDVLWLLKHPPVITVGARREAEKNLLQTDDIEVVSITRGGDVTYHDEGQITGYLMISLGEAERDLHKVLHGMELAIIECLNQQALAGDHLHTVSGKTGVFHNDFKVCSIGIACRKWVTFHGFSLCFDTASLNWRRIHPCGLDPLVMKNLPPHFSKEALLESIGLCMARQFGRSVSELKVGRIEEIAPESMQH